jgi:hypothetical protein
LLRLRQRYHVHASWRRYSAVNKIHFGFIRIFPLV